MNGLPMERVDHQPPGHASDDDSTDPVPVEAAPPTAERISSFLLHIRRRAAGMAVDSTLGAATPADTARGSGAAEPNRRQLKCDYYHMRGNVKGVATTSNGAAVELWVAVLNLRFSLPIAELDGEHDLSM